MKPLAKEIAIAHAVREALPKMPLCADANCGLTLAAAKTYIEKTRKAALMFVEQPLAYDDIDGLKKLAKSTKVPIGIDEGIHSLADIETNARAGAGGMSLKLIKLGGISAAVEAGKLCQRLGLSVNIAVKIAESSIGSSAALHLACAVPKADWGVSLTHLYLAEDVVKQPLPLANGLVALPRRARPRRRGGRGRCRALPRPLTAKYQIPNHDTAVTKERGHVCVEHGMPVASDPERPAAAQHGVLITLTCGVGTARSIASITISIWSAASRMNGKPARPPQSSIAKA